MSDPLEELEKTCEIIGEPCKILANERKEKKIDDITFIQKYFTILETMPTGAKKQKVLMELDKFRTGQEEVSFRDEPVESEIKSE
jgi:hypothetical protein